MAQASERTRALTTEQVLLIHASLEPATIRQNFQSICAEHLGPSAARVFTFVTDDPTQILPFGWGEDPKPVRAPEFDGPGFFGAAATPIEGTEPQGSWCALLPLTVDTDAVGVLQVTCDHAVDRSGVALLQELARVLGQLPQHCIVYAIEGADFRLGAPLSPPVAAAVRRVAADLCAEALAAA